MDPYLSEYEYKTHNYSAMFAADGMIETRRARVLMIARSEATAIIFRTSYHEHTGASAFDRSIDGKHDSIIMGLVLIFRKAGTF